MSRITATNSGVSSQAVDKKFNLLQRKHFLSFLDLLTTQLIAVENPSISKYALKHLEKVSEESTLPE